MHRPFRFLHASDLHLERPPRGLAEIPDHLRSVLVEAPYRAAERIFDAAIKERVDFVVLSGDVIDPLTAGPRGMVFLADQFRKLSDKNIAVYWAGGRVDDFQRWRDFGPLGEVVHRFPLGRVDHVVHQRDGEPLAQILGTSSQQRKRLRAAEFHGDGSQLFCVGVAFATADAEMLAGQGVQYWALGSEHSRRTLLSGPITAHYPGTPQGRRPQESGQRGCSLVHVDEEQRVRISFISTDAVRYQTESLTVTDPTTPEQFQQIVDERVAELLADPFGPDLLVQWTVSGSRALEFELRHGKSGGDLTNRLRGEHGSKRPALWTVALEPEAAGVPEALFDEDTVLGELLRTVRHYVDNPDDTLSFEPLLAERHVAGNLGASVALDDPAVRRRVLAEVARLGMELLGPREARS